MRLGVRRLSHGEEEPDAVGQQPACDEAEEVGRLLVQPLRVVDHAQHGPGLGRIRQQREHRQPDEERIGRRSGHQTEGHAQRAALRIGKALHRGQERHEQLVDGGEAEALLRLDGHRADDLHVSRKLHRIAKERRLAHARLTPEHQRTAHTLANTLQHPAERLLLGAAVDQPHTGHPSPDRARGIRGDPMPWSPGNDPSGGLRATVVSV